MHIKHIHDMIEKLSEFAKCELDKGIEQVETKEMGEVAEIIKELAEAEYYAKISKAMDESEYGEDYDEYGPMDDGRRGYRGRSRDSMGRFTSRGSRGGRRGYEMPMMMYDEDWDEMERMRDMDRMSYGRMGYSGGGSSSGMSGGSSSSGGQSSSGMSGGSSGGGSRGYSQGGGRDSREGRSGQSRRSYMESKEMHKDNSPESKQHKMKELETYMKDLSEDVTEMIGDMSQEEKTMLKNKMNVLMQKIG